MCSSISFDSTLSASQQIETLIKRMIADKGLQPGDPLPTYDELCEQFNVSPVTLKRGLDQLYEKNVIYSRRGKGIFVNKILCMLCDSKVTFIMTKMIVQI